MLNVAFFCNIDTSYLGTFFGTQTAPQYACELFLTSDEDSAKFDAAFGNRISYTKAVHPQVREWVAANLARWQLEMPKWFRIEQIPDSFLPSDVFEAEGRAKRRRSSMSLREMVGIAEKD